MRRLAYRALAGLQGWKTVKRLDRLHEWEQLSKAEIHRAQEARLKQLLLHAHTYAPYYRRVLEDVGVTKGGGAADVSLDAWADIPLLDKRILQEQGPDLVAQGWGTGAQTYWNTSGGSTGEPARFLQDAAYKDWTRAKKLLFAEWAGKPIGAPEIVLWASGRDATARPGIKSTLSKRALNKHSLSALNMSPDTMRDYVRTINRVRPVLILAYVEGLYELARFIEEEGLVVFAPRSIMTSAGTLLPHIRETIERVFGAPVFNRYGSREVGDIASECERHMGLHVSPLTHYVEILRPDGSPAPPGEVGEIVVTLLINYAMPLIRYRIGDMGAWADRPCDCGRHWPLLQEVTGRITDVFLKRDGTRVYGSYFRHVLFFQDWIQRFQCIQEDYDRIRLVIVPKANVVQPDEPNGAFASEREDLEKKIRGVMGSSCKIEWEFVRKIETTPSGKYRYTISKVSDRR